MQSLNNYRCNSQHFIKPPSFITIFTIARISPLSWAIWIQPVPSHSRSLTFILILSSHLGLGLPSLPLSIKFPLQNSVCIFRFPMRLVCPAVSLFLITYLVRTQIIKLLYVTSSILLLLPRLRPKFIPLHPFLQHRRPMFYVSSKSQSFTPTWNNNNKIIYPTCIWASILKFSCNNKQLDRNFRFSLVCQGRYQDSAFNKMLSLP